MSGLRSRLIPACLLAAALVTACDEEFTPLAPTDLQFSVFGYLDANADTQWVRVGAIRPLILTSPDPFDGTVTLENLGTGQMITMRDSVFRFTNATHPEIGSEGVYAHNFFTTEPIEAGASYRFRVQREDEDPSEAIVKIPENFDVEVSIGQNGAGDFIRLIGVEHLAFISAHAEFYDGCGDSSYDERFRKFNAEGDVYTVGVERPEVPRRSNACGNPIIERLELWATSSGDEWPSGLDYATWNLSVPEGASNISNSLGFLGGVLIRNVLYEKCEFVGPRPVPSHCTLRYDDASATLRGTVREVRCHDGALDSVQVTMTELDGEPASQRRFREYKTPRDGSFEIGALVAGMRYGLRVRAKPLIEPFVGEVDIHSIYTDTVQFAPGEERSIDVGLERFTAC